MDNYENNYSNNYTNNQKGNKKTVKIIIIAISVFVLVFLIAIAALIIKNKFSESQSEIENTVFSLDGQLEDCILLLDSAFRQKNIEIETEFEEVALENVHDLLKEVWINLLNNAVKFTGENGRIFISVKQLKRAQSLPLKTTV